MNPASFTFRNASAGKPAKEVCSVQIELPLLLAGRMMAFGRQIDSGDFSGLEKEPLETRPHVTILYGLHPPVTQDMIQRLKWCMSGMKSIRFTCGMISTFEQEDHDVLKIDMMGADLHDAHRRVKETTDLPMTVTYPEYKPHATLAYLRKGAAAKYLAGVRKFEFLGFSGAVDALTLYSETRVGTQIKLMDSKKGFTLG